MERRDRRLTDKRRHGAGTQAGGVGTRAVIARMRAFNRFYTRRIGVLRPDFLGTELSLTEARVLYELAHRERATARELCAGLGLDPGYLSRVLKSFEEQGIVERRRLERDRRARLIRLTAGGRQRFAELDARQTRAVEAMVDRLDARQRRLLTWAMSAVEEILKDGAPAPPQAPP